MDNIFSLEKVGVYGKGKLYKEYESVLGNFLSLRNPTELMLCGSLAEGRIHIGSDINLFILDETLEYLHEEKLVDSGITISVFSCSEKAMREKILEEKDGLIRKYSSYLASGRILRGEESFPLINFAKEIRDTPLPTLTDDVLGKIQTYISHQRELALYYSEYVSFVGFSLRFDGCIDVLVRYYFELSGMILPSYKVIAESIPDKKFRNLIEDYITSKNAKSKYKSLGKILDSLEKIIVGYTNIGKKKEKVLAKKKK